MPYDLAIIGSGAAAFAAAITARRQNASVVMVERGTIGGTCVNTGCVPSKALLAAAEIRHRSHTADRYPGLRGCDVDLIFADLVTGKDELVEMLRAGKYADLAEEYGWSVIAGKARFADMSALVVDLHDGSTIDIEANHYLIATGSAPWTPAIPGLARINFLTSTTAMALPKLPRSMVVIGGNAIGLEQAQLFSRLGTRVTVIEAKHRLAPFDEPEASQQIEAVFADEGITVQTGVDVTAVRQNAAGVKVTLGSGLEIKAEHILVATGRRPVTADLNLDAIGVKVGGHGEILVDEHLRTTNARVFAAGDVTGHPQFVYVAAEQGAVAAENALSVGARTVDYRFLPRVTFTSPALASAGLTEEQALEAGHRCDCRVLPLEHVPRAIVNRDTRGMVKLVADADTGRLLGVHAVAEAAGELAAAGVYALSAEMTVDKLAHMWCPYLTMSEGIKLAAQTFTRDISKLSCCAV